MKVEFFDKAKFFQKVDFYKSGKDGFLMSAFCPLKTEKKRWSFGRK